MVFLRPDSLTSPKQGEPKDIHGVQSRMIQKYIAWQGETPKVYRSGFLRPGGLTSLQHGESREVESPRSSPGWFRITVYGSGLGAAAATVGSIVATIATAGVVAAATIAVGRTQRVKHRSRDAWPPPATRQSSLLQRLERQQ